jgi:hypothetical protein
MDDDEILSADLLLTPEEIYAEFQERCEEAAESPGHPAIQTYDLQRAAKALVRVLYY